MSSRIVAMVLDNKVEKVEQRLRYGEQRKKRNIISWEVFMSFVDEDQNASRILSSDCFNTWVNTRQTYPKQPEESFRRVLIGHICGIDRRRPFNEKVEASLLKIIRQKKVWECFRGTEVCIGIRGFRKQGFHEGKRLRQAGKKEEAPKSIDSDKLKSEIIDTVMEDDWDINLGLLDNFDSFPERQELYIDVAESPFNKKNYCLEPISLGKRQRLDLEELIIF